MSDPTPHDLADIEADREANEGLRRAVSETIPTPKPEDADLPPPESAEPDWTKKCEVCGATPILPVTGMCGPCTWGEAETAGGNW